MRRSSTSSTAAATVQSFTSRRVTAIQHGEQIFHMSASFQVPQPGVEHQTRNARRAAAGIADGHRPGTKADAEATAREDSSALRLRAVRSNFAWSNRSIRRSREERAAAAAHLDARHRPAARRRRAASLPVGLRVGFPPARHAVTLPHARAVVSGKLMLASIDHAMWLHSAGARRRMVACARRQPERRRVRAVSPAAASSPATAAWSRSTAQEGLMRCAGARCAAAKLLRERSGAQSGRCDSPPPPARSPGACSSRTGRTAPPARAAVAPPAAAAARRAAPASMRTPSPSRQHAGGAMRQWPRARRGPDPRLAFVEIQKCVVAARHRHLERDAGRQLQVQVQRIGAQRAHPDR